MKLLLVIALLAAVHQATSEGCENYQSTLKKIAGTIRNDQSLKDIFNWSGQNLTATNAKYSNVTFKGFMVAGLKNVQLTAAKCLRSSTKNGPDFVWGRLTAGPEHKGLDSAITIMGKVTFSVEDGTKKLVDLTLDMEINLSAGDEDPIQFEVGFMVPDWNDPKIRMTYMSRDFPVRKSLLTVHMTDGCSGSEHSVPIKTCADIEELTLHHVTIGYPEKIGHRLSKVIESVNILST